MKKPELTFRTEAGTQTQPLALGHVFAHHTGAVLRRLHRFSIAKTDGFNISRFGNEKDGHRAFIFNCKGGVDLTESLNVEGVFRHINRKATVRS